MNSGKQVLTDEEARKAKKKIDCNGNGSRDAIPSPGFENKVPTVEEIQQEAEKIRAGKAKIREAIPARLKVLTQVSEGPSDPQLRDALEQRLEKHRREVRKYLHHDYLPWRQAAITAACLYVFGNSSDWAVVSKLLKQGVLKKTKDGPLQAGKTTLSPSVELTQSEIEEVSQAFSEFVGRAQRNQEKQKAKKLAKMDKQSNADWPAIRQGEEGICLVGVPPQKAERNGETFWRGGGALLVKSDGEKIYPIQATGSLASPIEEAREKNVFLLLDALNRESPPYIKGLPIEMGKKVRLLWYLLKRAEKEQERKEDLEEVRQQMEEESDTSTEDWFLNRTPGTCLVYYEGVWKTPNHNTVEPLFFLASREEKEDTTYIRVVEVPDHLEGFLGDVAEGEYQETEKFENCPQPLRAILQACYGQEAKTGD